MKVKLHPAETLLNKLAHAERKRSGSLLERQKAEFDLIVEALAKARGAALEEAAQTAEAFLHSEPKSGSASELDGAAVYSNGTVRRIARAIRALAHPETETPEGTKP